MLHLGRRARFIASMEQAGPREARASVKNRVRKHENQSTLSYNLRSLRPYPLSCPRGQEAMSPELSPRHLSIARPFMGRIQRADFTLVQGTHPLGAGPTTHENCSPCSPRPALDLKARTLVETTTMLTS